MTSGTSAVNKTKRALSIKHFETFLYCWMIKKLELKFEKLKIVSD